MQSRKSVRTKHTDFIIIDIIVVVASLVLAHVFRFDDDQGLYQLEEYRNIGIAGIVLYFVVLFFSGIHSMILKKGIL